MVNIEQKDAALARIVTEHFCRLQLPNGEFVNETFDKIEYTDNRNIFLVTLNEKTKRMKLEKGKLIEVK